MNPQYDREIHNRKSIRLRGYDYTSDGAYYITLVTQARRLLFGDIVDGTMHLNNVGRLVVDAWNWLGVQYRYVALDSYVVMPNHFHGIILISDPDMAESSNRRVHRKPLGRLVAAFKTVSTKQFNIVNDTPGHPLWQRNYYKHVIRNNAELERVRNYIVNNPQNWQDDLENPTSGML